jgi:hypothetical protein
MFTFKATLAVLAAVLGTCVVPLFFFPHHAPLTRGGALPGTALAAADCVAPSAAVRTQTVASNVNRELKIYMCPSLESSCIHPDPQAYQALYPNATTPWWQSCVPFGENAITATENGVTCTAVASPNNATCSNAYTVAGDLGVYFYLFPCTDWWGTLTISCTTFRRGDDWTDGNPNTALRIVDQFSFTANVVVPSCNSTTCVHGSCQFVRGSHSCSCLHQELCAHMGGVGVGPPPP